MHPRYKQVDSIRCGFRGEPTPEFRLLEGRVEVINARLIAQDHQAETHGFEERRLNEGKLFPVEQSSSLALGAGGAPTILGNILLSARCWLPSRSNVD